MPATMRQITFSAAAFASATSTPVAASGTVRFVRQYGFTSGGQFIEPGHFDAAYGGGAFTAAVYLAVPDDAAEAARYTAKINGAAYPFSLAQGAAADLATLIAADTVEDVSAVSQLLSSYLLKTGIPTALLAGANITLTWDAEAQALTIAAAGGGAPSGPAGGVLSGTYPDPGFAADMATQAELDAEATARATADTTLQTDINTRALASALAAYAQLAVAQTFTKAQTVQGEAANEATGIFYVKDSAGNTIMTVRKSTGVNDGRLLFDAGNVANVPWVKAQNLPSGSFEVRLFAGGGYLIMSKDGNGVLDDSTGHVRRARVNTDTYSTAGKPSHSFEDEGRAAIDTLQVFPGDTANTSKDTGIRRKTSAGADALAGHRNAYFYDTTHATRKGAHTLSAIDYTAERVGLEVRADGTQVLTAVNGAAPVARQSVTGSRGGNAALASLLTALAAFGIITDNTTA